MHNLQKSKSTNNINLSFEARTVGGWELQKSLPLSVIGSCRPVGCEAAVLVNSYTLGYKNSAS